MKKQLIHLLLVVSFVACFTAGCSKHKPNTSSLSASEVNKETLMSSVSGIYKGQTVTLSCQKITNHIWPQDMPVIHFLNGIAVFYDYGEIDNRYEYGGWNCIDTQGNILFDEPFAELSNFNKDGIAYAKKTNGEYVYVDKTGQEIELCESYTAPSDPLDPAHPEYITLFKGDFETQGDSFNPPIRLYDKEGTLISSEEFQNIGNFCNGLAPFLQNGKLGLLFFDGQIVIPATYETDVSLLNILFWEDRLIVECEGRLAILKVTRG